MKKVSGFFGRIIQVPYMVWAFVWFVVLMLAAAAWAVPVYALLGAKGQKIMFPAYKLWARCWFLLCGIRLVVENKHHINEAQPAIIAANHSSHLDVLNGALASPLMVRALAKVELKKIPVLGYMFQTSSVFVDRSSPESRKRSVERLQRTLNAGFSLFLFPEGTRNRSSKPLTPFYDGAFRIAILSQRPIVPLVVLGATKVFPMKGISLKPGTIRCRYLPGIQTLGMNDSDLNGLKEQVYGLMEAELLREQAELYS
jgi:1-acyl-sn-glycerol-3-phosphate acyltransferase